MGLLILGGMLLTIAYGTKVISNDIKAEYIDDRCTPTLNVSQNKQNIAKNFVNICKRSGIRLSNTNKPINIKEQHKGVYYLQKQGYDEQSVEYFKTLFNNKYNDYQRNKHHQIRNKHYKLRQKFDNADVDDRILITFRHSHYGNDIPVQRMMILMENELWQKIVNNWTYIPSNNSAKYVEIWNLSVPKNFFNTTSIEEVYREICQQKNLKYGI